jgi:hypothetical protein
MLIHQRAQEKDNSTIVQPLLHYHVCNSIDAAVSTLVVLQTRNEFEIVPS